MGLDEEETSPVGRVLPFVVVDDDDIAVDTVVEDEGEIEEVPI